MRISRLPDQVVLRIAAGEIIQRPCNAVKELVENSLDAGATSISIVALEGGLRLLQIQDNGHGIEASDLSILCERYTTSKLRAFEDLGCIQTFGFRGEALASISQVARIELLTKTEDSLCASQAMFVGGKLQGAVKQCAANRGTIISVHDLFYNSPLRKAAIGTASDEYGRIVEVVQRYALDRAGIVEFALRKSNSAMGGGATMLQTIVGASGRDCVMAMFGNDVAQALLDFELSSEARLALRVRGLISNPTFSQKSFVFILFINNRLVECARMKKAIQAIYAELLLKNTGPFVYLSLTIDPHRVDVNVHPTKKEVIFLDENETIMAIVEGIRNALAAASKSLNLVRLSVIKPVATAPEAGQAASAIRDIRELVREIDQPKAKRPAQEPMSTYAFQKVRTDFRAQKLDTFAYLGSKRKAGALPNTDGPSSPWSSQQSHANEMDHAEHPPTLSLQVPRPSPTPEELHSIAELKARVEHAQHPELTRIFRTHVYVGLVDEKRLLMQHETRLYMVVFPLVFEEAFYQIALNSFGRLVCRDLALPIAVRPIVSRTLIEISTVEDHDIVDLESIVEEIVSLFQSRRDMLAEYFSICFTEDGEYLQGLPGLVEHLSYKGSSDPDQSAISELLASFAMHVDWNEERACLHGVLKTIAKFYVRLLQNESSMDGGKLVEHAMMPRLRSKELLLPRKLVAPAEKQELSIKVLADTHDLYKIFERC